MFDERGWELFSHWLWGNGAPLALLDKPEWDSYMKANKLLRPQLQKFILEDANRQRLRSSKSPVKMRPLAVEIENGYRTGYQMLHGTGNFSIEGPAPRVNIQQNGGCSILYPKLRFAWIDDIDPNPRYPLDTLLANIFHDAGNFTGAYKEIDYDVVVAWEVKDVEVFLDGKNKKGKRYPFDDDK